MTPTQRGCIDPVIDSDAAEPNALICQSPEQRPTPRRRSRRQPGDRMTVVLPHDRRLHMGYHMVMARREVLVQLDDDLVDHLDQLARTLGTNRSELLRRGAQAVIDAEDTLAADRDLVAAYRRQPTEPALVRSAARLAARTTPGW